MLSRAIAAPIEAHWCDVTDELIFALAFSHRIILWSPSGQQRFFEHEVGSEVSALSLNADGSMAASAAGNDGQLLVWLPSTLQTVTFLTNVGDGMAGRIVSLSFSADAGLLLTLGDAGLLLWYAQASHPDHQVRPRSSSFDVLRC